MNNNFPTLKYIIALVFWGEAKDSDTATVYCYLKQSILRREQEVIFKPSNYTNVRCLDFHLPEGLHLFFVKMATNEVRYPYFKMVAKPLPILTFAAWRELQTLCNVNFSSPIFVGDPNFPCKLTINFGNF